MAGAGNHQSAGAPAGSQTSPRCEPGGESTKEKPMSQPNPKLRFGLWYAFRNPLPWRRSYQDIYAEILEQIVWAEGIGYDDVWLTEHHFADDGHAPSPLVQA